MAAKDLRHFQLIQERFDELIDAAVEQAGFDSRDAACTAGWTVEISDVVTAAGIDYSAVGFDHGSPANMLAWLAYVLSISRAAGNPPDVAAHGFIGCSARGPQGGDEHLILLVRADGLYQVASPPIGADDLIGVEPDGFDESVERLRKISETLLETGNECLAAARGAAAASPW